MNRAVTFPESEGGFHITCLRKGVQPWSECWLEDSATFPDEASARAYLDEMPAEDVRCIEVIARRPVGLRDPFICVLIPETA